MVYTYIYMICMYDVPRYLEVDVCVLHSTKYHSILYRPRVPM